jgi:quercetin dioxygenase-like cupin family protein
MEYCRSLAKVLDKKMSDNQKPEISALIRSAQIILPCSNLPEALEFFTRRLGFRIEMIVPADSPRTAIVSGYGVTLRLELEREGALASAPFTLRLACDLSSMPEDIARSIVPLEGAGGIRIEVVNAVSAPHSADVAPEFVISRIGADDAWSPGRAGMQYRDLIPSRLGGRFIASHIRIPDGGETPDYVHFHKVRFQMIYCKKGWARLVYEDQGPPFVLQAGDCVLQPPEIRHRVLESSPGLEVIEISSPAIHETYADHDLSLPTAQTLAERLYGGQRFVLHRASNANWEPWIVNGFEARDTGIAVATNGLASARIVRPIESSAPTPAASREFALRHTGEFYFLFVLKGELTLDGLEEGKYQLWEGDSCVLPANREYVLRSSADLEMLEARLPAGN